MVLGLAATKFSVSVRTVGNNVGAPSSKIRILSSLEYIEKRLLIGMGYSAVLMNSPNSLSF
jgi:hypothetical protein